jgi:hypothetical protein
MMGKEIWDNRFPNSCHNPDHQAMDVCNGLLIWTRLVPHFQNHDFTMIKEGEVYRAQERVHALKSDDKKIQDIFAQMNGMKIKYHSDLRDTWPGEKFLQLHNLIYNKKREIYKAGAAAKKA